MLSLEFGLNLHADQIKTFGGLPGIRDLGGLESALEQPWLEVFGQKLHPTLESQAAALLFHLSRNHPYLDGNKRVAWASMEAFLFLKGYALEMDDNAAYHWINAIAQGEYTKEQVARTLLEHLTPLS